MRSPVSRSCYRIKSLARAMCVMRLWLRLPVASRQPLSSHAAALTSSCHLHYPPSIHHLENTEKKQFYGVPGIQLCIEKPARKWLVIQSSCFFLMEGRGVIAKSSNYFFLTLSISPSEQKGIWEAHYRVIISQGRSPLSASELCLICLGRCWRGTQQRRMFMFAAMWNLTALFWHPCIATTPPLSSCVQ